MNNSGPAVSRPGGNAESEQMTLSGYRLLWWPGLAVALLVHIAAFTALLRHLGLMVSPFFGFTKTLAFAAGYLFFAVGVRLVVQRWLRSGASRMWSVSSGAAGVVIGEFCVIVGTMALLTVAYSWPKVMVQVLNPRLWDLQLGALDRVLCFGVDPNEFLLTVFEGSPAVFSHLLDRYYSVFVFTQSIGAAWFLSDPRARMRAAFGIGFLVLWMIGTWCYVAIPALGPAYVAEDLPARLWAVFPSAAQGQAALYANYMAVKSLAGGAEALVVPHLGIAAMPSLHVGVHLFLYLWAVYSRSRLRPVFLAMTLLTFVGSVATAWHYVVDGLAGAILAAGAFWLAVMAAKFLLGSRARANSAPQSYNPG
jgi:hypothetical protein